MHLIQDGRDIPGALYAKVIDVVPAGSNAFAIRFTSVSPEIERFLEVHTAAAIAAS